MTHCDMAESVENAFMRNHSVCAREYVACVIELHGHGISLQFVMPGPVPVSHNETRRGWLEQVRA
jgi:hypothetical protein